MPPHNAQQIREAKINAAKRSLENPEGTKIKEDKIVEWALLEIVQQLHGINFLMGRQNARPPIAGD